MTEVPKHPSLTRRNSLYYHRAAIPSDIRHICPKREDAFSLRIRDPRVAIKRMRCAANEVDARFDEYRFNRSAPPSKVNLTAESVVDTSTACSHVAFEGDDLSHEEAALAIYWIVSILLLSVLSALIEWWTKD